MSATTVKRQNKLAGQEFKDEKARVGGVWSDHRKKPTQNTHQEPEYAGANDDLSDSFH